MAPTGTNRRANKYSYLAGQFDRQISARSLLVEASGPFSRTEIPNSITESGGGAGDLIEQSGKDSVIDLTENSIATQPCTLRGVSDLCKLKELQIVDFPSMYSSRYKLPTKVIVTKIRIGSGKGLQKVVCIAVKHLKTVNLLDLLSGGEWPRRSRIFIGLLRPYQYNQQTSVGERSLETFQQTI